MAEQKKSFVVGHSQVVNWFIAWMFLAFINSAGTNIYRNGVCEYYGLDPAPILTGSTIAALVACVVYLFIPKLGRKVGAKPIVVATAIITGLSWYGGTLVNNATWVAIMIGVSRAASNMCAIIGTMMLVAKWFPRKKSVIMGIITSGGLLSALVLTPVFNSVLTSSNVKTAGLVTGASMIAYGVASIFWLKETPEQCGLQPDNMPLDAELEKLSARNAEKGWKIRNVFSCKKWWLSTVGWGLVLLAIEGFIAIAVTYMLSRGIEMPTVVKAISAMGIIQFACSNISGVIDSKVGVVKTSWIICGMQIVGLALCSFYFGPSMIAVLISYWLILGSFGATNNLYSSQVLSIVSPRNFEASFSLFVFVFSIIKAFGTFVAGRSVASTGGYVMAYRVYFVCVLIGIILISLAGSKLAPEVIRDADVHMEKM
ncbi:MAG: MFS transporter [Eubacterium sp.]|nr:MFS transporter [Eubacterium sp.]